MTYQELITRALLLCGKGYEGQVVLGQTLKTAIDGLNDLLGLWEVQGHGTWRETEYKFCLTQYKPQYTVGSSQDIDILHPKNISEIRTKTISGAVTWKGEITIAAFLALTIATEGDYYQFTDSNSDINIGDYGVLNTDITTIITSTDYDIVDDSGVYIDLQQYRKYDYQRLPAKNNTGTPVIYHYEPGTNIGYLYLWRTGNENQHIIFTAYTGFETITTANVTDDIAFPDSWRQALLYGLSVELGLIYGTPGDKLDRLKASASAKLEAVVGSNVTESEVIFYARSDTY
jgi:hypothetical protein